MEQIPSPTQENEFDSKIIDKSALTDVWFPDTRGWGMNFEGKVGVRKICRHNLQCVGLNAALTRFSSGNHRGVNNAGGLQSAEQGLDRRKTKGAKDITCIYRRKRHQSPTLCSSVARRWSSESEWVDGRIQSPTSGFCRQKRSVASLSEMKAGTESIFSSDTRVGR